MGLFESLGEDLLFCDFQVQNIVASFSMEGALDLELLAQTTSYYCSYEPEVFPGLVLRCSVLGRKLCILVFRSGKCVVTGAKTQDDIQRIFHFLATGVLLEVRQVGGETSSSVYRKEVKKRKLISLTNLNFLDESAGAAGAVFADSL